VNVCKYEAPFVVQMKKRSGLSVVAGIQASVGGFKCCSTARKINTPSAVANPIRLRSLSSTPPIDADRSRFV
jgi:hypothetical protein